MDMKLKLVDDTEFNLYDYSYSVIEPTALFKLTNTDYSTIKEKFTDENCATMLVTTSDGITIAEFKNYYVHGGILIDDDEAFYSVNMQRKGIAEMYTVVKQQVEDLEENLTQSQADVAYLTIMTDLDENEESNDE